MKLSRRPLLLDPPAMAAPDIAFILIVFFLVCASTQPDTGRSQTVPKTESEEQPEKQSRAIEVSVTRGAVVVNGEMVALDGLASKVGSLLRGTQRDEDRIVVVKSTADTPYDRWITVTATVQDAGGIITLEMEEDRTVTLD